MHSGKHYHERISRMFFDIFFQYIFYSPTTQTSKIDSLLTDTL
jgi:hypothetical protein